MSEDSTERRLVLVDWIDSCRHPREWTPTGELADPDDVAKPEECHSVGWVMYDEHGGISLCPNLSGVNDNREGYGTGGLFIPRSCIVRVRDLTEGAQGVRDGKDDL